MVVLPENLAFMGRSCGDANALREAPGDGPLQACSCPSWRAGAGVRSSAASIPMEADHRGRAACLRTVS